ncbi:hypothetical protein CLV68_5492 [Actinokineospora cianjurensis]|uniref:Anti-anti-sigma factor n=2 Tax=Actinokineospora cianjurensis TaxID=585224 RepID=A0A421AZ78_9PSEU|nr:hypothetical protein CLV68_5492 [Actinokineospora cianjurensis]
MVLRNRTDRLILITMDRTADEVARPEFTSTEPHNADPLVHEITKHAAPGGRIPRPSPQAYRVTTTVMDSGAVVVRLTGLSDTNATQEFGAALRAALESRPGLLVADLFGLRSAGKGLAGELLSAYHRGRPTTCLRVVARQVPALRALSRTPVWQHVEIYPTLAYAVRTPWI